MTGKATWNTPLCVMKNREEIWTKLENSGWKAAKVDTNVEVSYFGGVSRQQKTASEYDLFFSYTKVFPLWDQLKRKDNCKNLQVVRENFYNQEKDKAVPVLTSFTYGQTARVPLDFPETSFRRTRATDDFKRRRGVEQVDE